MGVFGIIYAGFKYRNWEKEAEYEREQYLDSYYSLLLIFVRM